MHIQVVKMSICLECCKAQNFRIILRYQNDTTRELAAPAF